jgi:gentisate 1,2-dioxygenase
MVSHDDDCIKSRSEFVKDLSEMEAKQLWELAFSLEYSASSSDDQSEVVDYRERLCIVTEIAKFIYSDTVFDEFC